MVTRQSSNSKIKDSPILKSIPILISSCLLGIRCRYDGKESGSSAIFNFAATAFLIPICPEQLGGLPTPRPAANIIHGDGRDVLYGRARVLNKNGDDITDAFKKGAEETHRLAQLYKAPIALLKHKSPSCGVSTPYCDMSDGFGMGVTAALLESSGIRIIEINPKDDFPLSELRGLLEEVITP